MRKLLLILSIGLLWTTTSFAYDYKVRNFTKW